MKDKYHRLCLLCEKYIAKNRWKNHLIACEKEYKKSRGIHGNYNTKRQVTEGGLK